MTSAQDRVRGKQPKRSTAQQKPLVQVYQEGEHTTTGLARSVAPPSIQWMMWWASVQAGVGCSRGRRIRGRGRSTPGVVRGRRGVGCGRG